MPGLNKVIKTLILSDFLLQSGWGLIGPIFAIFITQQVQGGSLVAVGLIAATYWFVKSMAQPFIAHFLDVKKGEKDDFRFLILGLFLANLVPLGYVFASQLWHVFLLEVLRGICMACVVPSWAGIFTRHIDKGWEAFSWSIESTGVGLAAAFAAAFGGIMANFLGFKVVFVLVAFFGLSSSFLLLLIRNKLFPKDHFEPKVLLSEKPERQF
jgi:predicted MFS family arabinose efflux permease